MSSIDEVMERLDWYSLSECDAPPTEEDLTRFERELGGRLPADYRDFLLRYGAAALGRGARFPLRESSPLGDEATLDVFYGLDAAGDGIEPATLETYAGRIPDETVPIGEDPGGNLVVLAFDGPETGRVWLWDHEHSELAERIEELRAELGRRGVDTSQLDDHAVIWHWERLDRGPTDAPPGHSNLYRVADSFTDFINSLQPEPNEARG